MALDLAIDGPKLGNLTASSTRALCTLEIETSYEVDAQIVDSLDELFPPRLLPCGVELGRTSGSLGQSPGGALESPFSRFG